MKMHFVGSAVIQCWVKIQSDTKEISKSNALAPNNFCTFLTINCCESVTKSKKTYFDFLKILYPVTVATCCSNIRFPTALMSYMRFRGQKSNVVSRIPGCKCSCTLLTYWPTQCDSINWLSTNISVLS